MEQSHQKNANVAQVDLRNVRVNYSAWWRSKRLSLLLLSDPFRNPDEHLKFDECSVPFR